MSRLHPPRSPSVLSHSRLFISALSRSLLTLLLHLKFDFYYCCCCYYYYYNNYYYYYYHYHYQCVRRRCMRQNATYGYCLLERVSRQFYVYVSYGEDVKLVCDVIVGTVPLNDISPTSPSQVVITKQPTAKRPTTIAVPNNRKFHHTKL